MEGPPPSERTATFRRDNGREFDGDGVGVDGER